MTSKLADLIYGGGLPCPRGHGSMDKQPGIWVLQQVRRLDSLGPTSGNVQATGKLLTMETHICPTCGHIELINERSV